MLLYGIVNLQPLSPKGGPLARAITSGGRKAPTVGTTPAGETRNRAGWRWDMDRIVLEKALPSTRTPGTGCWTKNPYSLLRSHASADRPAQWTSMWASETSGHDVRFALQEGTPQTLDVGRG